MGRSTMRLPLHGGKCPPWLFARMKKLGAAIVEVIVAEFGPEEVLRRLSDPYWFQALGCVLGFDWHSSGVTTTVCGALKEGLAPMAGDLGLFIAGGKGGTSRKTPLEIEEAGSKYGLSQKLSVLPEISRLVAKVDNNALQDGYQLYHHVFLFTCTGHWTVVQQGMNETLRAARRYHWCSLALRDYFSDPHTAVCAEAKGKALNLAASESENARRAMVDLGKERPDLIVAELRRLASSIGPAKEHKESEQAINQPSLFALPTTDTDSAINKHRDTTTSIVAKYARIGSEEVLPTAHAIPGTKHLERALSALYEKPPQGFQELLLTKGVGSKTLRALAMVAEVTYGAAPSFKDPARYSFAHGGKDGHPFPIDRAAYDNSIQHLESVIRHIKVGDRDRLNALRKLATLHQEVSPTSS